MNAERKAIVQSIQTMVNSAHAAINNNTGPGLNIPSDYSKVQAGTIQHLALQKHALLLHQILSGKEIDEIKSVYLKRKGSDSNNFITNFMQTVLFKHSPKELEFDQLLKDLKNGSFKDLNEINAAATRASKIIEEMSREIAQEILVDEQASKHQILSGIEAQSPILGDIKRENDAYLEYQIATPAIIQVDDEAHSIRAVPPTYAWKEITLNNLAEKIPSNLLQKIPSGNQIFRYIPSSTLQRDERNLKTALDLIGQFINTSSAVKDNIYYQKSFFAEIAPEEQV